MSKEIIYRKVYSQDRLPDSPQYPKACETYSTELGELKWWGTDWQLDMVYERPKYWFEPIEEAKLEENIIPIFSSDIKCVECKTQPSIYDYNGYGHWVCKDCGDTLEKEFEDEYR